MPLPPLRSIALLAALASVLAPPGARWQPQAAAASTPTPAAAPAPGSAPSSSLFRPTLASWGEKSYWSASAEVVTFDVLRSNSNRGTCGCDDYYVSWETIKRNREGPWVV